MFPAVPGVFPRLELDRVSVVERHVSLEQIVEAPVCFELEPAHGQALVRQHPVHVPIEPGRDPRSSAAAGLAFQALGFGALLGFIR